MDLGTDTDIDKDKKVGILNVELGFFLFLDRRPDGLHTGDVGSVTSDSFYLSKERTHLVDLVESNKQALSFAIYNLSGRITVFFVTQMLID